MLNLMLAAALAAGPGATPKLDFDDAWIREAPPGAAVLAGYVSIANDGKDEVVLATAASDDFAEVEFHEMSMVDGMMKMRGVSTLTVPANGKLALAPGGLHLMLHEPKRALAAGDDVTIEFTTADGAKVEAKFEVRKPR